jgi:hypothetical protein
LLAVNHILVSAGTFGACCLTRVNRDIDVFQRVANNPDTGSRRVVAAVFGQGVKGGTDHLTGSAAIAFVGINFYGLNDFLFLLTSHGYTPFSFSAEVSLEGVSPSSE